MRGTNGTYEVLYGEYPQYAVSKYENTTLENLYKQNGLKKTGKSYTTDSNSWDDYNSGFKPMSHEEFVYNNKKYIRFISRNEIHGNSDVNLSNGLLLRDFNNVPVWILVEPISWLVDEKTKKLISKRCLFAGIRFNPDKYDCDFKDTEIHKFMNEVFLKEIKTDQTFNQVIEQNDTRNLSKRQNPYGFDFNYVSEEDIIRGSVEADVSVFLHGASSEGKSARVKQLDPDLEIIYLRNATPDSLNGKSVVMNNETLSIDDIQRQKMVDELVAKVDSSAITLEEYTNELSKLPKKEPSMFDIPPTWYKKLKAKCEAEPSKIHILFFDEITNALPSIQGMAYNIVLDKEVNGIWKLPSNARIVAAGNEMEESLSANKLSEPLFNRFAHVYIHTTVEDWLEWATTPEEEYQRLDYEDKKVEKKIHPAIISYIAYKREQALRSDYNGIKPNADPRKWELSSKVLYKTNNPQMLRSLVGEDLTIDFVTFCEQQVITLEDVLSGNYDNSIFDMDISQKWATSNGLLQATEKDISKVSEFVERLGSEQAAMFYRLWSGSNKKRQEKISEIIEYVREGGKTNESR